MPKKTAYTPAPDSLAARVCAWFRLNSEEELTAGDIATKFDVPRTSVHNSLAAALSHEAIVFARSTDEGSSGMFYRAGPNLAACEPAIKPSRRGKSSLPPLDCRAIEVEQDVTPPPMGANRVATDWTPLLERLVASSATKPIPKDYQYSATKALKAWRATHGGEYAMRSEGADHFRIYRTA